MKGIMKYCLILLLGLTGARAEVKYNLDNLTYTEEHIRPFINDVFQAYCYGLGAQRTQIDAYLVKYWTYLRAFDTRPYDFCISYIRVIKTLKASAYIEIEGYLQVGDFSNDHVSTGMIQTSWNMVLDDIWSDRPVLRTMRETGLCNLRNQLAEENDPKLKAVP
jgi:hypothetical protein